LQGREGGWGGERGALRIRTGERGLYRLTYANLAAAGVPVTTAAPSSFAMSYLGQPVDIQVTGEADGRFDPGDLVIFYAEPYRGRYQNHNVYWFTWGGAPGSRIATRAVTPTGAEPVVTQITRTLHVEFDREYYSTFTDRPKEADHWFDTALNVIATDTATKTITYTLTLANYRTTGDALLAALVHGGVPLDNAADRQAVQVQLNEHVVGVYRWDGGVDYALTATVPAAWLDAAPNRAFLSASRWLRPDAASYQVYPDWLELIYPATAAAAGDRLYIEAIIPGPKEVVVTGFTTDTVKVYDVRDGRRPVQLTTTRRVWGNPFDRLRASSSGLDYAIHFWDADLPDPTYFLSAETALLAPLAIEPDAPSTWGGPDNACDYIAIVHRSLWDAIQPLLDHRAAEGFRVAKVDVQDLYDEFSFGRRDPEAIRSFLSYAYHHWRVRPQYVLLVGDGHYDFTGVSGTTLPNLIPPYLVNVDPELGETAADNRYVSVDGPDDYLPDMHIGRIPARNPADVTAVVSKTLAYERAPAGDWQRRVVFVADDCADETWDFNAISEEVRLNWLPASYDGRTIYFGARPACPAANYSTPADMRAAIKAAFDARALLVQWFGHGSRFRWGGKAGSQFNIYDPPALAANTIWPVSFTYACWTGYFISIMKVSGVDQQTLGETLLLTPERGSVADLSPSGLHVGDSLVVLNQGIIQAIFRNRIGRLGPAVDAARLYYFSHTSSFHDVIDTSVLFGDPALRLRLPPAAMFLPLVFH
jgi:hypothetical protein